MIRGGIIMPVAEQRGGAEQMLLDLLQHTGSETGVRWQVIFLQNGPLVAAVRALNVAVHVVEAGRLREGHRFVSAVARIASLARRERWNVLVGWMTKAHLYGGPAAILAGVPALWYQCGVPAPSSRMERLAARLPTRGVFTLCEEGRVAQQKMCPACPVRLVYPGVDLARFDPDALPLPAEARRRLGLPTQGVVIGMVGRLQRWKGMHVLVEALPAVQRAHPGAQCVIVGGRHDLEPEYASFLEQRIAALGLTQTVHLSGLQHNVPEWMQAMDVVVHASENEPFGIVVVEAMALGKAVIAGAAGGPAEIITEGVNGLLSPYGDVDALAGRLQQCLDDPHLARRLGMAARHRAADFSSAQYALNFLAALRDLLAARGAAAPRRRARSFSKRSSKQG